ncbi:MAG: hypothetical protein O7G85_10230, partial [Planctomycetota bacterium]|nr:hypothetical protein [Planctomycetota bacterium]
EPEDLRIPQAALEYAERACVLSAHDKVRHLRTLALACHRTGQSARAIEYQTSALELTSMDDDDWSIMQAELDEYQAGVEH